MTKDRSGAGSPDRPMQVARYLAELATLRVQVGGPKHAMVALDFRALPAGASPLPNAFEEFHFVIEARSARELGRKLLELTDE